MNPSYQTSESGQPDFGWNTALTAEDLVEFGPVSLALITNGASWVMRRIETVELLDEENVRQQLSLDFRIPTNLKPSRSVGSKETYFLPLTFMQRRSDLLYFDVKNEDGTSIPLLTRQDNGRLTGAALVTGAKKALDHSGLRMSPTLNAYLASIPVRSTAGSMALVKSVLSRPKDLFPNPAVADILLSDTSFCDLLALCSSCSIVHVALPAKAGERHIVKMSWVSRWGMGKAPHSLAPGSGSQALVKKAAHRTAVWLGWRPEARYLFMPQIGGSETQHVQFSAPSAIEFTSAVMKNRPPAFALQQINSPAQNSFGIHPDDSGSQSRYEPVSQGIEQRKHLYLEQTREIRSGVVWVGLRASMSGFRMAALATAITMAMILLAYAMRAENIPQRTETAAALVLLVPALISGLLVAPGEHPMSRRLLRGPRLLTTILGFLAIAAVGLLVLTSDPAKLGRVWALESTIAFSIVALLGWGLREPPPIVTSEAPEAPLTPSTKDQGS